MTIRAELMYGPKDGEVVLIQNSVKKIVLFDGARTFRELVYWRANDTDRTASGCIPYVWEGLLK